MAALIIGSCMPLPWRGNADACEIDTKPFRDMLEELIDMASDKKLELESDDSEMLNVYGAYHFVIGKREAYMEILYFLKNLDDQE